MQTAKTLLSLLLLVVVVAAASGCGSATQQEAATPSASTRAVDVRPACEGPPLKAAAIQDKSISSGKYRTPQVKMSDLQPLVEHIRRCGGELAVGLIRKHSNNTLARLYVPEPNLPVAPEEPSRDGNPFEVEKALVQYKKDTAAYKQDLRRRQREVEARVDSFEAEASAILSTAPDSRRTDVWGGIRRAELFLNEPSTGWKQPPRKVMLLVSDARDNVKAPPVSLPLKSGATVVLVNGAPELGALQALKRLRRFEAIDAAIRNIEDSFNANSSAH